MNPSPFRIAVWIVPVLSVAVLAFWSGRGWDAFEPDRSDAAREVRGALDAADVQLSVDRLHKDFLQDFRTMHAQVAELQRQLAASEAKREAMRQLFILQGEKHELEQQLRDLQTRHRIELDSLASELQSERKTREEVERRLQQTRADLAHSRKQIEYHQSTIAHLENELRRMETREAERIARLERREANVDSYYLANSELFRKWTSSDGRFTTIAKLVKYDPKRGKVFLRKASGRYVWVDVDRLSREDQDYILQRRG